MQVLWYLLFSIDYTLKHRVSVLLHVKYLSKKVQTIRQLDQQTLDNYLQSCAHRLEVFTVLSYITLCRLLPHRHKTYNGTFNEKL